MIESSPNYYPLTVLAVIIPLARLSPSIDEPNITTRMGPHGIAPECPIVIVICGCVKCVIKLVSGCIMKIAPLDASSPVPRSDLCFHDKTNAPVHSTIAVMANTATNDSSVSPVCATNAANHDSINNILPARKSTATNNVAAANPTDRRLCSLISVFACSVTILTTKIVIC